MELCQFVSEGSNLLRCTACNRTLKTKYAPEKVKRVCRAIPSAATRLVNFSQAAIAHAMNGWPSCTQEQIDERLTICRSCPLFNPRPDDPTVGVCTHSNCGCNVNGARKYLNKLAWADQQCPRDPPLWLAVGQPPQEGDADERAAEGV